MVLKRRSMPVGRATRGDSTRAGQRWLAAVSVCALAAALAMTGSAPVSAETLQEALAATYRSNPRIDAERARLRATDEDVARAQSGFRPQVGATAEISRERSSSKPSSTSNGSNDPWGYQVNITQPIFSGFRTTNAVGQAEAGVRAGREDLRSVEAEVLLEAVRAYCDVVRDQSIVRIRDRNVEVLSRELDAARTRRAAREVTKTDVSQAEARRARAVSEADFAKANLKIARARYLQTVGHAPTGVSAPSARLKALPRSLDEALEIAERESPIVVSSLYREEAARYNVDKISGELLPEVQLEANYSHAGDTSSVIEEQVDARITGRISVPLYEGGETRARVRQAKHTHVSLLQEIEQARTETTGNVTAAWSRLIASRAQLKSDQIQVEATQTALEGVREEERVGQRTLLDVLNAEQEYLEAQVQYASTKRDLVLAGYTVLGQIGRLTGDAIEGVDSLYDPEEHYQEARDEWFSTDITDRPHLRESRDDAEIVVESDMPPPVEPIREQPVRASMKSTRMPDPISDEVFFEPPPAEPTPAEPAFEEPDSSESPAPFRPSYK